MIDGREADDVRAWLATADAPSLRLDLGQTVQTGRAKAHRRRVGRIAGAGALAVAVLLAVPGVMALANRDKPDAAPTATEKRTPSPDGPFSCTFQALPAPAGLEAPKFIFEVTAVDPSGRYVIATSSAVGGSGGDRKPVLWDHGVGKVIAPQQLKSAMATAVSENGIVAGNRQPADPLAKTVSILPGWVYRDGTVSDIPVPAGAAGVEIVDINPNGDLLGTVTVGGTFRPAIWRAGNLANPEYLTTLGETVNPIAFLADGGGFGYRIVERTLYVWNAQGQKVVHTPPAGADVATAVVAPDGWVYSQGRRPGREEPIGMRWKLEGGEPEWLGLPAVTPPAQIHLVKDVAENGARLYSASSSTGPGLFDSVTRMFVARGDHVAQLPAPDGLQAYAQDMDQYGRKIAGHVSAGPNSLDGFTLAMWTC